MIRGPSGMATFATTPRLLRTTRRSPAGTNTSTTSTSNCGRVVRRDAQSRNRTAGEGQRRTRESWTPEPEVRSQVEVDPHATRADSERVISSEVLAAGADVADRVVAAVTAEVHQWGPSEEARAQLESAIAALPVEERSALFAATYDQMPQLRDAGDRRRGPLMYAAAGIIGNKRPPPDEAVLVHVLRTGRHDCGHGLDTRLPFDLAFDHLRDRGWSPVLGEAIQAYAAGLPTGGTVVQSIKRSADLLLVLDRDLDGLHGAEAAWWINTVRSALAAVDGDERVQWERLVLAMRIGEQMTMPKTWVARATPILEAIGPKVVGSRLAEWWPRGPKVSLKGSGAQLLKHLIWCLGIVEHPDREALVTVLAHIEWTPKRPMAVLKPAAEALTGSTSDSGLAARDRLRSAIED